MPDVDFILCKKRKYIYMYCIKMSHLLSVFTGHITRETCFQGVQRRMVLVVSFFGIFEI